MKLTYSILKKIALLSLTILLFTNCGDKKENTVSNTAAVNVIVATTSAKQGTSFFSASGQIETKQHANISTRVMGYVSKVHVQVGDIVKKGQLLININNTDIQAKNAQANAGLNQAKAGFYTAEKDYVRFQKLYKQNSASQKELENVTTQYEIAKAQVEVAKQMQNEIRAMISYTNIKAPFNGVITSKTIHVGDMAKPGMPMLSMEAPSEYIATALVSETNIIHIQKGENVTVFVKSIDKKLQGVVTEISTSSLYTGGQYLVKIALKNVTKTKLFTGMFVTTNFTAKNIKSNTITIPKAALIYNGQLTGIYTVSESNTAILRWLKTGNTLGDNVEVFTGISKNEKYIISADGKLYNGVKLNIK